MITKAIICKCDNPSCGKELLRQPWHAEYYKKIFCNKECQRAAAVKYDSKVLEYVKLHINTISFDNLVSRLGVTKEGLLKQLSEWRTAGHEIPARRKENRNPPRVRVATIKPVVKKTDNIGKLIDKKQSNGASQRHPKEDKLLIIKDFSNGTYVRKDSRTWVCKKLV